MKKAQISEILSSLGMLLTLPVMLLATKLGKGSWVMEFMRKQMHDLSNKERAFKGYQPTIHDVFVCTYSKSGTNWMMQIAYQIAHRGHGEFTHIHDVVPWPDAPMPGIVPLSDESAWQNSASKQRVIKTHLESPYVPYSPDAKYIIVARDPKEAFVSSYHFYDGMIPGIHVPPVEQWLTQFFGDKFFFGSWSEHLASYWQWRTRPNVLWLSYGEMKADLPAAVRRVAHLMGVALTVEEEALVVEKSSFRYMKEIDHKFMPQPPFSKFLPQQGKRPSMMRQGAEGKSSELLTIGQQQLIDEKMQAELRQRQCDFPYTEIFRLAMPAHRPSMAHQSR